jgi:hypothetical protein
MIVTPWTESASDRRLSAKLVPTFRYRGVSRGQRGGSPTAVDRKQDVWVNGIKMDRADRRGCYGQNPHGHVQLRVPQNIGEFSSSCAAGEGLGSVDLLKPMGMQVASRSFIPCDARWSVIWGRANLALALFVHP